MWVSVYVCQIQASITADHITTVSRNQQVVCKLYANESALQERKRFVDPAGTHTGKKQKHVNACEYQQ
jgi:hypothetical protein